MNRNSGRVWVNFKELRARLRFEDVLRHHGVTISSKGEQHQGPCPLPQHPGRRDTPSFSAHLGKGVFQCFACGGKGNTLEFAALMEGIDPKDGSALRKVAVGLQLRFCPEGASSRTGSKASSDGQPAKPASVEVNAPLDFELKGLEHVHPSLTGRGFEHRTNVHFGVGFCSRGLLKGRVAIPLHDAEGRLVGYAGESVGGSEGPRHLFPERRERKGSVFEFDRSLFLYNGHRVRAGCDELVVVRDFPSVWWLRQCGFGDAVAVMGPECSEGQAEQALSLVGPSGRIWVMPDGDGEGEKMAWSLLARLSPHRFVRWAALEAGLRPTDLTTDQLKTRFTT